MTHWKPLGRKKEETMLNLCSGCFLIFLFSLSASAPTFFCGHIGEPYLFPYLGFFSSLVHWLFLKLHGAWNVCSWDNYIYKFLKSKEWVVRVEVKNSNDRKVSES